ncbi:hypothetical protein GW17_00056728, partial [Ensete ventricosum]
AVGVFESYEGDIFRRHIHCQRRLLAAFPVLSSLPCPSSSTDHRAELAFFGAPDCLERRNFRSPLRNREAFWSSFRAGCDLKRPKEATIEAVLVKERKQYAAEYFRHLLKPVT